MWRIDEKHRLSVNILVKLLLSGVIHAKAESIDDVILVGGMVKTVDGKLIRMLGGFVN